MITLENLSKIGLGTYRMSIGNKDHFKSLDYAVESGVNLIDTASNYVNGNSERLIGLYAKKRGRDKIFIISKAGYIHGDDLRVFSSYLSNQRCIKVQDGFYYSFEKSFLEKQIKFSLNRLNTGFIDGFLIHNPEYFLSDPSVSESMFYDQIAESLIFLEELVKDGVIRYYGISSNKLPTREVNIWKILTKRNDFPNLKLLQFPYNFIENEASAVLEQETVLEFCRKNDIRTFANRPLTTNYNKKVLRIADYSKEISNINFANEQILFDQFISIVSDKLKNYDSKAKPTDFVPLNIIITNRKEIANPEAVDKIVYEYLLPFLNQLQFDDNHHEIINIVKELTSYWKAYAKKSITNRAVNLKKDLISKGEIEKKDVRDFSLIACEKYLDDGINHILVGMRKIHYINKLKSLF